jgi:ferric-dicitrate binding protein FerR (iron transport regulator)
MRIRRQKLTFFVIVMFIGFVAGVPAMGRTADVVGKVVNSSNATLEGDRLLPNSTIFSGDAIDVAEGGSVLVSFSSTGRAVLTSATRVRFNGARGNLVAQLVSGTLAVERQDRDALVVKTSTYNIEPQGNGKAEFVVASFPNKRTTVETQHGNVLITETQSGERYTLAEGLLAEISPAAAWTPGQTERQHKVIGNVVSSKEATQNEKPLSNGGWVNDGDLVSTGATGRAVLQLLPTNQVTLDENTSASFSIPGDRVLLQLQKGTIVVENKGERNVLIETTRLHIEPNSPAPSSTFVTIRGDNSIFIEAVTGDVRIRDTQSDQTYLLPAGQNALIPANASGVPGLQTLAEGAGAPTPKAPPTPPPAPGVPGHSHNTLIILGVAGGGGIAAAAAIALSGGGGTSGPPASPVVP